jgi:hypothetical protein
LLRAWNWSTARYAFDLAFIEAISACASELVGPLGVTARS